LATTADNIVPVDDAGWETVVEPYADTFPFETEGATLMGIYVNKRQVEQEGLDGNPRQVNVYEVTDNNGKKWSVWGSAILDTAFESIQIGNAVKVAYEGTKNLDGGRTVKTFTVQSKAV
jgi:hypothetical protein